MQDFIWTLELLGNTLIRLTSGTIQPFDPQRVHTNNYMETLQADKIAAVAPLVS